MKKQKKQASVLIVALIILSVILVATLSFSMVALITRKASIGEKRSNLSFQIANSGIEKVLLDIKNKQELTIREIDTDGTCDGIINEIGSDKGYREGYAVELRDKDEKIISDCDTAVTEIDNLKSNGVSNQNQRSVTVKITTDSLKTDSDIVLISNSSTFNSEKAALVAFINKLKGTGDEYNVQIIFMGSEYYCEFRQVQDNLQDLTDCLDYIESANVFAITEGGRVAGVQTTFENNSVPENEIESENWLLAARSRRERPGPGTPVPGSDPVVSQGSLKVRTHGEEIQTLKVAIEKALQNLSDEYSENKAMIIIADEKMIPLKDPAGGGGGCHRECTCPLILWVCPFWCGDECVGGSSGEEEGIKCTDDKNLDEGEIEKILTDTRKNAIQDNSGLYIATAGVISIGNLKEECRDPAKDFISLMASNNKDYVEVERAPDLKDGLLKLIPEEEE